MQLFSKCSSFFVADHSLPVSVEKIFQKINTTLAYLRSLKKLGLFRKKLAEKMNSLCSHCLPDCQVEIVGDFRC